MKASTLIASPLSDYRAANFFVLRTPLLPLSVLSEVEATSEATDPAAAMATLLGSLIQRPDVAEALYLASPSLSDSLASWIARAADSRAEGATASTLKYILRMAARCTPFGLFSGCSVGSLGATTALELEPRARHDRHTRLDMGYVVALITRLNDDAAIRARSRFHPNSTIYRSAATFRYAESRPRDSGGRENCVVEVEATQGLSAGIDAARRGMTLDGIAEVVASAEGVDLAEGRDFVEAMIDNQVLVSELEPSLTGEEPTRVLLRSLQQIAPEHPATKALVAAHAELAEFDRTGTGISANRYRELIKLLEPLPRGADGSRLFHVDLFKPAAQATMGERVVRDVATAIDVLQRISPSHKNTDLVRFMEAFQTRWETAEVSLALALDEERGIGFGAGAGLTNDATPLLDGIAFPSETNSFARFGSRESWLIHRASMFSAASAPHWDLSDADVIALTTTSPLPLPDAFGAMFTLIRSLDEERNGEPTVVLHGISGPSGANLMGRFCHGSAALRDHVRTHLAEEEALAPDAIFAELVHLPEGRTGNILARPLLRRYEIAYLGRSGTDDDATLSLDDLLVTVRGGRVVLLSRRLGKEVRPRLTSAHNHAATQLPIYRFLNALGGETHRSSLGWDWGPCASSAFLPRVSYRGIVLSPATWNVSRAALGGLADAGNRMSAMATLSAQWHLPRWVCLVQGDNVLPLDLQNQACVDILAALSKDRGIVLRELLSSPINSVVSSIEGTYSSEVLLPFVRSGATATPPLAVRAQPARRRFSPGSEWTYAKFYCGSATVDLVLQCIEPALREWLAGGAIDRWFFVRYGDPNWHLRLRVRGRPESLRGRVLGDLTALGESLAQRELVWRVQLDTYEREVERYGGHASIDIVEEIFWADSEFVLQLIKALARDDESERRRWLWALRGCDHLLGCFGMDIETKHAVAASTAKMFAREFGANIAVGRAFGQLFRRERQAVDRALGPDLLDASDSSLLPALDVRRTRIEPLARELVRLDAAGCLVEPLRHVLDSVVHMFFNRVLKSEHRRQEFAVHDLLSRTYESRLARSRRAAEKGLYRT